MVNKTARLALLRERHEARQRKHSQPEPDAEDADEPFYDMPHESWNDLRERLEW